MILINGLECKAKQTTLPFALLAFCLLFSTLNVNKEMKLKVGPPFDVICKQESFNSRRCHEMYDMRVGIVMMYDIQV
jgi:hypothetical protein